MLAAPGEDMLQEGPVQMGVHGVSRSWRAARQADSAWEEDRVHHLFSTVGNEQIKVSGRSQSSKVFKHLLNFNQINSLLTLVGLMMCLNLRLCLSAWLDSGLKYKLLPSFVYSNASKCGENRR